MGTSHKVNQIFTLLFRKNFARITLGYDKIIETENITKDERPPRL